MLVQSRTPVAREEKMEKEKKLHSATKRCAQRQGPENGKGPGGDGPRQLWTTASETVRVRGNAHLSAAGRR